MNNVTKYKNIKHKTSTASIFFKQGKRFAIFINSGSIELASLLAGNRPKTSTSTFGDRHGTRPSRGCTQPSWLPTEATHTPPPKRHREAQVGLCQTDGPSSRGRQLRF